MNKVSDSGFPYGAGWQRTRSGKEAAKTPSTPECMAKKDRAELTPESERKTEWQAKAEEVLDWLTGEYPQITVMVTEQRNGAALSDAAFALGSGTHILLSEEFIDRMGSGREEFLTCEKILKDVLQNLSKSQGAPGRGAYVGEHQVTFWSVGKQKPNQPFDAIKRSGQSAGSSPSSVWSGAPTSSAQDFRMKIKRSSYTTASEYARLAGASTKAAVRAAMGETQRSIGQLRLVASLGDQEDRAKARVAISSLQKLLLRGNRKIRRLNEEELVRLRKKRAEKQKEQQRAIRLRAELNRRRRDRSSADNMLVEEGKLTDLNNAFRFSRRRAKDDEERYAAETYGLPSVSGALEFSGPAMAEGGVGAEVTFTSTIEF